jgi:ABC-type lipoprotein export system ATPase subunit
MIEATDLTKIYNDGRPNEVQALVGANVAVEDGKITACVGPSGCGKTTLMSVLGLLLTPTRGSIYLDRKDVTRFSDYWKTIARRENMGFVFQHINLLPHYTAIENVLMPLLCRDVEVSQHMDRALKLLELMGLSDKAPFQVEQLSGGQQQRIAVARALITDPKTIIADEPITFVDAASAEVIMDVFRKLREEGKAILISTHSKELAAISDVTYRMKNGRIVDEVN